MKKLLLSLLCLFTTVQTASALPAMDKNPFFGDYGHQVALHVGTGVNSGFLVPPPTQFVPFSMLHFQYSLPTTFFELPARKSINVAQTIGYDEKYGWHWNDYTIPMIFLSEDIALLHGDSWYFGTGIGVGMQAQQNERIGSKLIFGFKLMFGFEVNETTNIEVFMQHFSNGNTAPENNSYAFYGVGVVYNF